MHHHGATIGHGSSLKYFHVGLNRVRTLAKNADSGQLLRHGPAMIGYDIAYVTYAALTDRTLAPLRGRVKGVREWRSYRRAGAPTRGPVELAPTRGLRAALGRRSRLAGRVERPALERRRARARVGPAPRGGKRPMKALETRLDGPILVEPVVHGDHRGFFHETYRKNVYADLGIHDDFVQDNHSRSKLGIVRGMHFQVGDGMAKLVRCGRGAIVDVVVDLRRGSPTFGEWEAFELNDENLHQLYCPVGFAHGFCVTSDLADVMYKCSAYYDESIERGIKYDDPEIGIQWPDVELIPSDRDASAPRLSEIADELPFRYAQ